MIEQNKNYVKISDNLIYDCCNNLFNQFILNKCNSFDIRIFFVFFLIMNAIAFYDPFIVIILLASTKIAHRIKEKKVKKNMMQSNMIFSNNNIEYANINNFYFSWNKENLRYFIQYWIEYRNIIYIQGFFMLIISLVFYNYNIFGTCYLPI